MAAAPVPTRFTSACGYLVHSKAELQVPEAQVQRVSRSRSAPKVRVTASRVPVQPGSETVLALARRSPSGP
ncbi:hypothetical protein ABB55_14365 [Prosthecomicrobium hirschii]|uniref:Uncharacterized protein n=1 Tax=Prosthecodimorpha hirschii TaxID=665126 RepID=A0A0N8GF39_9HYPH|nr:hypothetical protein ABB55_14365 [Prosthecomicrobium hirschii]